MSVYCKFLREEAKVPFKATSGSVAHDLYFASAGSITLEPGQLHKFPTGIAFEFPPPANGKVIGGRIFARSSMGAKGVVTHAGLVDNDFRGEIMVILQNLGNNPVIINGGDRIAQIGLIEFVTFDIEVKDDLTETVRGTGGFGSTGN